MDFVFSLYYLLDISESLYLKIGWKSHETQCNGSNLILLFTCPTHQFYYIHYIYLYTYVGKYIRYIRMYICIKFLMYPIIHYIMHTDVYYYPIYALFSVYLLRPKKSSCRVLIKFLVVFIFGDFCHLGGWFSNGFTF